MLCSLQVLLIGWCILGPAPFLDSIFDRQVLGNCVCMFFIHLRSLLKRGSLAGAWVSQVVGLLLLGAGVGLAAIPAYSELLYQARKAMPGGPQPVKQKA